MGFRTTALVLVAVWMAAVQAAHQTPAPVAAPRSVWDGVYTEDQSKRGAEVYARACARCHGEALQGDGEDAPALTGPAFLANWNGVNLGDMLDRMKKTMPDGAPNSLKRAEYVDVLAYMLSMNRFPTGKAEMEPEPERLKQIVFDAMR
jgi:S-disulfanyl-L-cysteine oxidoreductase SoxD